MEFKIGEKVRVKKYEDIPSETRSKGLARHALHEGEIVDILWSNQKDCNVYRIHFEGYDKVSNALFGCEALELVPGEEAPKYNYEFEFLENLVVARLYEIKGDEKTEIAKGHGHIFHDGVLGITQASSYALKKIYEKLNGDHV